MSRLCMALTTLARSPSANTGAAPFRPVENCTTMSGGDTYWRGAGGGWWWERDGAGGAGSVGADRTQRMRRDGQPQHHPQDRRRVSIQCPGHCDSFSLLDPSRLVLRSSIADRAAPTLGVSVRCTMVPAGVGRSPPAAPSSPPHRPPHSSPPPPR